MDVRDLHYFEAIAEIEHMGRASERLHRMPKPACSVSSPAAICSPIMQTSR